MRTSPISALQKENDIPSCYTGDWQATLIDRNQSRPHMNNLIELTNQVAQLLQSNNLLLAVAESCTGGGIAHAVTDLPGSSKWFECGFITYSNASKTDLLNVSAALIAQHGTVSEEVAAAMAEGALTNSNAHIALSTTGIAGPDGAVPGKPVGTVCFGWSRNNQTHTERLVFTGDRQLIRAQTVSHALRGLIRFLE
jgi:nicotinamide-nucleotide amidase